MPTSALALVTNGMIYPPEEIDVEVCDRPVLNAVIEVRPTIKATVPPTQVGPAGTPTVVVATELKPQILSTVGPDVQTGGDEPTVISSEELKPVIRGAEEE
jgi:hypothetical protein